jgi:hypothetical protein
VQVYALPISTLRGLGIPSLYSDDPPARAEVTAPSVAPAPAAPVHRGHEIILRLHVLHHRINGCPHKRAWLEWGEEE